MKRLALVLAAILSFAYSSSAQVMKHSDDVLQYVPYVLDLGLGAVGAEARHDFLDRGIETAIAFTALTGSCGVLKLAIDSPRPDGSDNNSFPSGHATRAFAGAEIVRMEYGWGWGAGAYAIATTVGVMRVRNETHWTRDVIAGAGLGILCAHVGEWLLLPVENLLGIRKERMSVSVAPDIDPASGALCTAIAFRF